MLFKRRDREELEFYRWLLQPLMQELCEIKTAICQLEHTGGSVNLEPVLTKLQTLEDRIMAELDILRAAFATVNTKLDELAVAESEEAEDLQNISDDLDELIASAAVGKLTPEDAAAAQALADRVAAHAEVSKQNAAFAKATAAKVSDPAPLPVPEPPPVPEG